MSVSVGQPLIGDKYPGMMVGPNDLVFVEVPVILDQTYQVYFWPDTITDVPAVPGVATPGLLEIELEPLTPQAHADIHLLRTPLEVVASIPKYTVTIVQSIVISPETLTVHSSIPQPGYITNYKHLATTLEVAATIPTYLRSQGSVVDQTTLEVAATIPAYTFLRASTVDQGVLEVLVTIPPYLLEISSVVDQGTLEVAATIPPYIVTPKGTFGGKVYACANLIPSVESLHDLIPSNKKTAKIVPATNNGHCLVPSTARKATIDSLVRTEHG